MAILLAVGIWVWIERVSWLIVIVGLILTVSQLRANHSQLKVNAAELKEVAEDIRAHSRIEFGFEDDVIHGEKDLSPESEVPASPVENGMMRITLTVVLQNCGNRTARELTVNFRFPEGVTFPLDPNKELAEARQADLPRSRYLKGYGVVVVVDPLIRSGL
jgi:hypothetical protein